MRFTLKEFEDMYGGFNPKIQLYPTDVAIMDGVKYKVELIDNMVELTEIEELIDEVHGE